MESFKYCKLEIFIPESHFAVLCDRLQKLDVGHIGNYDCCLSYSKVQGRWRPLDGSNPFIGENHNISCEEELKVEAICSFNNIEKVVKEKKKIHPYEEPVINVIPLYMTGLK